MAIIGEARPPQDVFHAMEEDEELFEEQIEQLLKQAETRLRQQQHLSKHDSRYLPTIPAAGKLDASTLPKPYVQHDGEVARVDTDKILDERQRKLADGAIRTVEDPLIVRKKTLEAKKATAGASWYNMPATTLTPALARDLQLLKMRNVLDPHRHYKKEGKNSKNKAAPAFSQVGTLIEGPTEFFTGRLTNKERKKTLVEEIMDGERQTGRLKRKYGEIQGVKRSGKKGDYNDKIKKRYGNKMKR